MKRTVLCALVWLLVAGPQTRESAVRIHFLDVGQGDAVLIQSPDGPTVLYDAGDSPTRITSHLERLGVAKIDLVIASHNHADHIGGLAEVIRRFRPRFYMDNGMPATTLTYRRVIDEVASAGTQLLEPTAREIRLGAGAAISVLPPPGIAAWGQNDNAVGAVLRANRFRLSLGGDAERRQWDWWVQHFREHLAEVTIHKASHHGSNNGDTPAALALLSPDTVVISVGANNVYGHPGPEALERYAAAASAVYRTDLHGNVSIELDSSGAHSIHVERGDASRRLRLLLELRW